MCSAVKSALCIVRLDTCTRAIVNINNKLVLSEKRLAISQASLLV